MARSLKGDDKAESKSADDTLADTVTPKLKKRLISSVVLLVVLMYFSMGHMMFGFPLPKSIENNHVAMGLIQLLLTTAIMVINQQFFISGFTSLWHRAPNMGRRWLRSVRRRLTAGAFMRFLL